MKVSSSGQRAAAGPWATEAVAPRPTMWWFFSVSRIIIGYLWLQQTLWKLPTTFGSPGGCPTSLSATGTGGLCDWMHREAVHPFLPLYGSFVEHVAIPNFLLFGWLTWLVEPAIAISLILGIFGRLGGIVGALWAVNLLIGLWNVPGEWYWTYVMLILINLFVVVTAANRYVGLDALLRRRVLPALGGGAARVLALVS